MQVEPSGGLALSEGGPILVSSDDDLLQPE
jgi:hypothetical protein